MGMMMLFYALSTTDRAILSILTPAIKQDLSLSDTQIGVLGGLAFAVLYAGSGIPAARLGERGSR